MKTIFVLPCVALGLLAFTVTEALAQTRLVNIQTVAVGDAGNAPQNSFDNRGAVGYAYRIGKFETTVEQYTAFLNSVASITTNNYLINLWNSQMGDKPWYAGVARSGSGTAADPYKYTVIGNANFPIDNVNWFDAARFCNWLHNGATNGASTETGAYTLNGATDGIIDKNTNAKWWIPSFNEWWKAAYYKGGSTNAGYWTYPTQSDTRPGNMIGGGTNQANYAKDLIYSVTQSTGYSPLQDYRTAVGTFSNSPSAYGTFDQAGNILEWNDATFQGYVTALVGGNWNSAEGELSGTTDAGTWDRGREWPGWGFRVAGVPDEDPDNDGVNNYREDKDGTDPNDATSFNALSKGLVLYYPFEGDLSDQSGLGNDLSIVGASSAGGYDRTGVDSRAFFTPLGSGGVSAKPVGISGNQSRTIAFWVRPIEEPADWPLGGALLGWGLAGWEHGVGRSSTINYLPSYAAVGRFSIQFNGFYAGANVRTSPPSLLGQWHHLVVIYSQNTPQTKIFLDGILQQDLFDVGLADPFTVTSLDTIDTPLRINVNVGEGVAGINGLYDEVRIYNRALSAEEVTKLYYREAFTAAGRRYLEATPSAMGHYSQADYTANRTNGQIDVTTNPSSFNLFTQQQFDNNRTTGRSDVINNPMAYGLYTSDSIMDLRMGGLMVQRIGTNAVVSFQPQTTTDLAQPFTNNGTPITNTIPMPGNKGFIRINAKP